MSDSSFTPLVGVHPSSFLLVVVGSTNPTKVGAVEAVLERAIAEKLLEGYSNFEVRGIEVETGVAAQPFGDEETILGASNRAARVLERVPESVWGVGIEGGVVRHSLNGQSEILTTAWCAILDRQAHLSYGGGLLMPLPPAITRQLDNGAELGHATDVLFNAQNSKRAGGALGYLSKGLENRRRAYESIFTYALVKFLQPELYFGDKA